MFTRIGYLLSAALMMSAFAGSAFAQVGEDAANAKTTDGKASGPTPPPTPQETKARFDNQITALDSDEFSVRDRASRELAKDARVTLKLIEQRLADSARPLTPEQN